MIFLENFSNSYNIFVLKDNILRKIQNNDLFKDKISGIGEFINKNEFIGVYFSNLGFKSYENISYFAKYSKAKKVLLTHFWPEYDINNYYDEAKRIFDDVVCASDNLEISI